MARGKAANEKVAYRESKLIPRLILILSVSAVVAVITFLTIFLIRTNINKKDSVQSLYSSWEKYDYESVYNISSNILNKKPYHNTALTFRGYSAFYLAVSQTDNTEALKYINEAITYLRLALLNSKIETEPQIEYMLGKAYFYKDTISSYNYYADLVVKYLTACQEHNYRSEDIPEYLGLSYAALGMTKESIASFTEALLVRDSDTLLLAIAEQYCKNNQANISKQYLYRIQSTSKDESILIKTNNLLGQIYIDEGNYEDARKEFEAILEKNENSADAHYGLGVIYEKQGDMAKARSEWRKCLKIQVNHPGAQAKMASS